MTLLPFVVVAFGAGTAALLTRHRADVAGAIGIGGLALAGIAVAIAPALALAGIAVVPGAADATVPLALGSLAGLLLVLAGAGVGRVPRSLPGATLLSLGWIALALVAPTPPAALLLATAAGATALLPLLDPGALGERGTVAAAVALRVTVAVGIVSVAVATLASVPAAGAALVGVGLLALAAAVAARLGVVPLHRPAARLAGLAPPVTLPLAAIWAPLAFAWVALPAVPAEPPALERSLVAAVAFAGIALALLAALIHDDLVQVVGYAIAFDGGVAMLAFASGPPDRVAGDLHAWLVVAATGRTALAAWAIAVGGPAGSRRLAELRGWLRRSPLLGLALAGLAVAWVGWPGSAAWEARRALFEAALGPSLGVTGMVVAVASLLIVVRLAAIGAARPDPGGPREPGGWRLRLRLASVSVLVLSALAVVAAAGWVRPG